MVSVTPIVRPKPGMAERLRKNGRLPDGGAGVDDRRASVSAVIV
jgi:hypothetical protein